MGFYFLAIFVAMPIIEIAVFIQAGELIGLWPTIGIVILTAVVGTSLMRAQGLQTLARAQAQIDQGEMPIGELFDGICILVAGVLLLTPGFVTDTMGFLLLVPPLRKAVGAGVIMKLVQSGNIRTNFSRRTYGNESSSSGGASAGRGRRPGTGPIIDGDFENVSPTNGNSESRDTTDHSRNDDDPRNLPPKNS
ncbi:MULTISPECIES: FxsA family protein [Thalassospira]|jgi:UPF0716 protein FxsA|uniref:Exclusion suppressor FxsA n=1 Tax=Thalassospira xiamenensis TaxID=220697 RepID=A0ABR5XZB6_9PROT|nr:MULTISPECIES: FxsA family protein [Thalassospira]KZD01727.1 exclusion suppressor FxsA [Thalassospira xiamenensis]KZD11210.1 exclusion suppressor FxsA [Thalassospira xiamenensis]MAB32629.1 exclusion suppressor FxsA [Thalassospira sp.]MBA06441.1 exclusion suppressor FxsA [Thalassospira sp.]MBL4840362.1 FxsA family protein [Thalassospira sp.]|tara:strand:- start:6451 stop:7029 length:579 start_codon:yes stop_codon:yes gene_type:complete